MYYLLTAFISIIISAFITYILTSTANESKWKIKWQLGICHDSTKGWQPLLERHLDNWHWEYIYINKENAQVIKHLAFTDVPQVPGPLDGEKAEIFHGLLQEMVNRGHGSIIGIEPSNVEKTKNA